MKKLSSTPPFLSGIKRIGKRF